MFSHLLVPLDGSPAAETALAYAGAIPARAVTLMLVIPPAERAGYDWLTTIADDVHHQQRIDHARSYLDRVAGALRCPGREIRFAAVEGDPAERIIESSNDAGLIVMTCHGEGEDVPDSCGRVVDRVVRHADKPVLVIRGRIAPDGAPRLGRLVVPLDGSETAAEAVPLAVELAHELAVPVHLVSVIDPVLAPPEATERASEHAREYLASECARLRAAGVTATTEVRQGTPAAELIAALSPDDLVVMTAFGVGTGRRWLLGGVAEKLIRSAPAPVLMVRPAAPDGAAPEPG